MQQDKSEAGRKGGEQGRTGQSRGGGRQSEQSQDVGNQAGGERGSSSKQYKKAGEQSHKKQ